MSKKTFFIFFAVVAVGLLGFQLLLPKPVHAYLPTGGGSGGGGGGSSLQVNLQVTVGSAFWNEGDIRGFKVTETPANKDVTSLVSWTYDSSKIQYIGTDNSGNAIFLNTGMGYFSSTAVSATYTESGTTVRSNVLSSFNGSPATLAWSFYPQTLSVSVMQGASTNVLLGVNHPGGWNSGGTPATTVSVNLPASSWPNGLSFSYNSSQFPGYVCVADRSWCVANGVDASLPTTITASSNMAPGTYYVFGSGTVENNSPTKNNHLVLTDLGTAYVPIVITVTPKPVINLTVSPTSITTNAGDSFTITLYNNGVQIDPSDPKVSKSSSAFIH